MAECRLSSPSQIVRVSPILSLLKPIFSEGRSSKTNIAHDYPFPGFTLLENDQNCISYVILWVSWRAHVGGHYNASQPKPYNPPLHSTWTLRCDIVIIWGLYYATNRAEMVFLRNFGRVFVWGGGGWLLKSMIWQLCTRLGSHFSKSTPIVATFFQIFLRTEQAQNMLGLSLICRTFSLRF